MFLLGGFTLHELISLLILKQWDLMGSWSIFVMQYSLLSSPRPHFTDVYYNFSHATVMEWEKDGSRSLLMIKK